MIWRSGSTIILYRGANYRYPYFAPSPSEGEDDAIQVEVAASSTLSENNGLPTLGKPSNPNSLSKLSGPSIVHGVGSPHRVRFQLPGETMLEEEADQLLDGLGPRYTDWWGYNPLPVDADLLPVVVPGYRRPFRLLPYGVKPKLTDREMTVLRRLGRPLPCHFALGVCTKACYFVCFLSVKIIFLIVSVFREKQETPGVGSGHDQALGEV